MNRFGQAFLYWHTLRHLKPVQFYRRLWFRVARPRPNLSPAPHTAQARGEWAPPADRLPSLLAESTFVFLGHEGNLAELGWDGAQRDKLWRYNQHYFDDLNALNAQARKAWHLALLQDWVRCNPPAGGSGWEPYPTSLRIVNWIKWTRAGHSLPAQALQSLAVQARWLAKRLEWHLLGNHLMANAKALVFAGLFFEGPEAASWLRKGLGIISHQLPEQVLWDGGNFERSPMYHSIFLEDMLDLINADRAWPDRLPASAVAGWKDVVARMRSWLAAMTHPDGLISFFNDAALGIAPTPAALEDYATRLGLPPLPRVMPRPTAQHLQDSGYIRLEADEAVAILDVAPVGPDYLPGHAHADTLSFELSIAGRRVVVNGGTSRYGLGPERLQERETRSHSTVEIDHQSSSEVWSGFRVARRARPFGLTLKVDEPGAAQVSCAHDGYTRLSGRPIHRRDWKLAGANLLVADQVTPASGHVGTARYILHPDVRVSPAGPQRWTLILDNGRQVDLQALSGDATIETAVHATEFGKVRQTHCLSVQLVDGQAAVQLCWS